MNPAFVRAFAVAATTVVTAAMAHAQPSGPATKNFDRGKYEYDAHCAVCHGLNGKVDGPFAQQLKSATAVSDLTELSKKNNGVFPFMRIYGIIDGT